MIVVVSGDASLRLQITRELALEGCYAISLADRLSAYDWIIARQPDLVILDPPDATPDGGMMLRRFRDNPYTEHIPIVYGPGYTNINPKDWSVKKRGLWQTAHPENVDGLLSIISRLSAGDPPPPRIFTPDSLTQAALASRLSHRPWDELILALRKVFTNSGLRSAVLPHSEHWKTDVAIDSSRVLMVLRLLRPKSSWGVQPEEVMEFRTLLKEVGLRFGVLCSLCKVSQRARAVAPLLGVTVLDQLQTEGLLEGGVLNKKSEVLSSLEDGSFFREWHSGYGDLRMFVVHAMEMIGKEKGARIGCSFENNGKHDWTVMSLRRMDAQGLLFQDDAGGMKCSVSSLELWIALAQIWKSGRVTLISSTRSLDRVVLYELLSLLPSLEGDGATIYRRDAGPDATTVPRNRPMIALLDDDGPTRELFKDLFCECYDVAEFENKDEFLCHIKHHPGNLPNLVVSDLVSPGMDGLDFLRRFKSDTRWRAVPVVIVTGTAMKYEKEAIELGADMCFAKPFNPDTLVKVVGELLGRASDVQSERKTD